MEQRTREFLGPKGIAVAQDGAVFVADTGNDRVVKYSPDGVYLKKWGTQGSLPGEFRWPQGIAFDSDQTLYVTEYQVNRVQTFTANGLVHLDVGLVRDRPRPVLRPGRASLSGPAEPSTVEETAYRVQQFSRRGFRATVGGQG